ncbi:MAG: tripartite tricarboxylate transporter substrate-binding protein [Azospirillaceae bacterium]
MTMRPNLAAPVAAIVALAMSSLVSAQDYPGGPVTLVVPFSPGGGTDYVGRVVAEELSAVLGESVVVENVPGAGTTIATEQVANAEPDGLTILINGSTLAFHPALFETLPYDVDADLRPVTFLTEQPYVLVVNNDFPAESIADLVALAEADTDAIPYGSAGVGSGMHISAEFLWSELGIDLLHIPYPGTSAAMNDLLAGEISVLYTTASGGEAMISAGEVRALGISSLERSDALPEVPTIAETAIPDYEHTSWLALFVPAETPDAVVAGIHAAVAEALSAPDVLQAFADRGLSVRSGSLENVAVFFDREVERWGGVIESAGIEPN